MRRGLQALCRCIAGARRDEVPCRLSIALGVPLLLALLISIWGWPFSWSGQVGSEPALQTPPVAQPVPALQPAPRPPEETAESEVPAKEVEESAELRTLRAKWEAACATQMETAKSLANLRSSQERELEPIREQRDKLILKVAQLQSELASIRETQARDSARFKEERERWEAKAGSLEREVTGLQAGKAAEKRRADAAEGELRKIREDIQAKGGIPPKAP